MYGAACRVIVRDAQGRENAIRRHADNRSVGTVARVAVHMRDEPLGINDPVFDHAMARIQRSLDTKIIA